MSKNNTKIPYLFLICLTFIVLFWSFVVHPFEFPDEQSHFETVEFLSNNNRLPGINEKDMSFEMESTQKLLGVYRNSLGQNKYTYHPEYHVEYTDSLVGFHELEIANLNTASMRSNYVATESARYPEAYYRYSGIFYKIFEGKDILYRLMTVRMGGVLITFLLFLYVFKIGRLLFQNSAKAYVLTSLVALQPMMSFVLAGINSDNLHNLIFTMIIYYSLRLISRKKLFPNILLLAACVIIDIYVKPQGIIAIPLVVIALIVRSISIREWMTMVITVLTGIVIAILSRSQISPYLGFLNIANARSASFIEFFRFTINKIIAQNIVWYWGVFKWLGVVLPPIYWQLANRLVLVSIVGMLVYTVKSVLRKRVLVSYYKAIFLFVALLLYSLSIFYFDWQYVKGWGFSLGIQARYFFPTIVSQMSLLMIGILSLGWNTKSRIFLRRLLLAIFVWLQLGGIWRIITSYYSVESLDTLIAQISQYKPWFLKGDWWYLWGGLYILSLIYISVLSLRRNIVENAKKQR